jgi:hypothetical protein
MTITDVAWVRDHRGRPALQLELDGHPAYVRSSQKAALLDRGIVDGIVFFASERSTQLADTFVRGDFGPELTAIDLIGCTDDPQVFALFEEMSRTILAGTWRPGPRPLYAHRTGRMMGSRPC